MAGINVNAPPINVPVVDGRGFPTAALRDFLYQLWQRTGGNDDDLSSAMSLISNGGYRQSSAQQDPIEQEVVELRLQGSGDNEIKEQLGSLAALMQAQGRAVLEPSEQTAEILALMHAQAQRHASEIAELRQEIDALRHAYVQRSSSAEAHQAAEHASTATLLMFSNALPQSTPY